MADWTATLFPDGSPLVYRSSLNGKSFAMQWMSLARERRADLLELESFLEIDTAVLGQGGSPTRQRTRLLCDAEFAPVRFESQSGSKRWSLDVEATQVVVHPPGDEAPQRLPRAGARFLFGTTGHQAVALAILHGQRQLEHASFTVFLPEPLLAVPYSLTRAHDIGDGLWLRSSHEEELLLDEEGRLAECRMPRTGVVTERVVPPPTLPPWVQDESIAPPAIVYTPPVGARFELEDVTVAGPVTPIGGTLTIPHGAGPFPAVLFLGGSGTHNRHGIAREIDLGTHEIVDYLAERGLVGLRYDSRGAGTTRFGGDALDLGLGARLDDAVACVEFLRERPEVERERIVLIGHSEGGTLALALVARRGVTARAVVLMAAMGRPIDEVMFDQLESQARVIGLSEAQLAAQRDDLRTVIDLVRADRPWEPGALPDHLLGFARSRTWLREHLDHPPLTLIRKLRCPVLVCQGEKDAQISVERDAEALVRAARQAGIEAELARFPNLDHLFKPTDGESRVAQFYDRSRRVSPEFLARLHRWIADHV